MPDSLNADLTEIQERTDAHSTTLRRAAASDEPTYLHTPSEVREAEEVEPTTIRCGCGAWSGVRCDWVGSPAETVVVTWVPEHHRSAPTVAGNWPHDGARRARVHEGCASSMIEDDGGWCVALTRNDVAVRDYRTGDELEGDAALELVAASREAGPLGVVGGRRSNDGSWQHVPDHQPGRTHLIFVEDSAEQP